MELSFEDKVMLNIINNDDLIISDELFYALRREIDLNSGSQEYRKAQLQDFLHLLGNQLLSINVSDLEQCE